MSSDISKYADQLDTLCKQYAVVRLELFGSALGAQFKETSDLDFLVEFDPHNSLGAFDQYFGLKEALGELFERSIDLVELTAIKNPYFQQKIDQEKRPIYVS